MDGIEHDQFSGGDAWRVCDVRQLISGRRGAESQGMKITSSMRRVVSYVFVFVFLRPVLFMASFTKRSEPFTLRCGPLGRVIYTLARHAGRSDTICLGSRNKGFKGVRSFIHSRSVQVSSLRSSLIESSRPNLLSCRKLQYTRKSRRAAP